MLFGRGLAASLTISLVVLPVATASAQSPTTPDAAPPMTADRPGFNGSAAVLAPGVTHLELGWSTTRVATGQMASVWPQPLLRIGVAPSLEVKIGSGGLAAGCVARCEWHRTDLSLGVRALLPAHPAGVALAVSGFLSLPTGHVDVSSHHVDPLLVVHADRPLGDRFTLTYNYLAAHVYDDAPDGAMRHGHGLSLGFGVGAWSPFVALARRPIHIGGEVPTLVEAGAALRVARDIQVDVTVSRGVTAAEPAWSVSAGLALRHRPR